jgi:type VI protein secretion system component VasK
MSYKNFVGETIKTMFDNMSDTELQKYIDGCHATKDYDSYFESACRERNSRFDSIHGWKQLVA